MPETLLATKLYFPSMPSNILRRQSLLNLLDNGLSAEKRLILVCAPAGYGKTTLVCDWLQNITNICWVSLEKSDNDPKLFFIYVIASLQKAFPGFGEHVRSLLETPQPPPLQTVLSLFLNDLAGLDSQIIFVLDDYQVIHAQAIQEGITFLLDHLPPNLHIVITTRSDPSLPLHRYRSRGQMVEIRAEDLRFSEEEIFHFMKENIGISLPAPEIDALENRTEGWVVGLKMAAISLHGRKDTSHFIQSLAGTNRHILDYLVEEVLLNQTELVQHFLTETAILDRLCAPLCDAIVKDNIKSSQEILQYLDHANLFIISLDDDRCWYRYHHLFQDLLMMRLKRFQPGRVRALHRSAANWYEENGLVGEAVHHYLQSMDYDRAADLVERHTMQLFAKGNLGQIVGWVKKLPAEFSARRPWLSIYQAWALAFAGKNNDALELIEVAIHNLEQKANTSEERKKLWAEIHGIRGLAAVTSGRLDDVLALTELLDDNFPPDSLFARGVVLWSIGYAWRMQGKLELAIESFREVLKIGRQTNNLWNMSTGFADLGMALRLAGRLQEAESIYREGLGIMNQAGAGGLGFIGRLESFLATILYEKNQVEEARQLTIESIAHNRLWNNPNHLAHAAWIETRILFAGNDVAAEYALKRAEELASHPSVVLPLRAGIEALRVRFWLSQGRLTEAGSWMEAHPLSEETLQGNTEYFEIQTLTQARILIAMGNLSVSWNLLERLETNARASGRNNALMEILTLKALSTHNHLLAQEVLKTALMLGVPEGYRRTFLDEGDNLIQLLESLRGHSALIVPLIGEKTIMKNLLTVREMEILQAIAEGLSNKEIGQRLFISAGTVKAHSAAIYRKLNVANRTGAIALAKDIGLL